MTCIVGVYDYASGNVLLGGDAAAVNGWTIARPAAAKVYELADGWIVGSAGSYALDQALRYRVAPPSVPAGIDDAAVLHRVVASQFLDAVRDAARAAGCLTVKDGVESFGSGSFLLGVRERSEPFRCRLFEIASNFAIIDMTAQGYTAIGAGAALALGSFYTTSQSSVMNVTSVDRVIYALEAAAAHNIGVCPPFTLQQLAPRVVP